MNMKRFFALLLALALCLTPLSALAEEYNIATGSITVTANADGSQTVTQENNANTPPKETKETVIKGGTADDPSRNTVTITAEAGATASVTLSGLNINTQNEYKQGSAALAVSGLGSVTIELDGKNTLTSGLNHAGLEKAPGGGALTIGDEDGDGSLTAQGGADGAGIGGGCDGYMYTVDGITITGGEITANGGNSGAGIGGGYLGSGEYIAITGGTVTATGGDGGAGIGGGSNGVSSLGEGGNGAHISITGGTVTAVGGDAAAGIGGGGYGAGSDINLSGSARVSVAGGKETYYDGAGAAIGNGGSSDDEPVVGEETTPKTDDLTCGSLTYYDQGTTAAAIQNGAATASFNYDPNPVKGLYEHVPGEPVRKNEVPATCTQAGSYDLVTYCTVGGEELSRKTNIIGKLLHTPGQPVEENVVPATCQHAGGYDLATYCTACGDEISREAIVIGKLLHTEGEPVAENLVPAKIGQEGSYDEVTYCTVCGDELNREHRVLPALAEEDPFTAFCNTLAERILAAPKNGTVEADASAFSGLQRVVFAALRLRPDVTLKVTCTNGQLTVPAGADLMAKLGDALTLTFEDIAKLLG